MKSNWIIFFILFSLVSAGETKNTHFTLGSNPAGTPGGGPNTTRPVADDDPTKGPEAEDEEQAKKDAALKAYQRAQSDGVLALAEDFIAKNKDLATALEDYIQSDSEKLNPTDIKDKFKELTGKELSEEELARLLVAASSDQTKDKNDAFIARTIDSAWKKDPSQRTPIEKAMLERAKELMRGKEEFYRELSKQSGISDVRSAFRFRKLSQLVKDGKNDEAAKVAADWLLNMSPEARKKVAEIKGADLDVDDRDSGLKFLKAGAQYASESNTLRRAAISVSKEFSTAWGKNEQSAKTWAQDVKNLSPEDLRKKYGPELDTWLAQKAANGGGGEITQIALGKLTQNGTSASVTIRNTDALTGGAVTVEGPTASSVVSQVTNQGFTGLSDAATNQKGQLNALRSSERGLFDSTPGPDLSALIGGPKTLKTSDHPDIVRAVRDAATRLEMAREHQGRSQDPAIKSLAKDTQARSDAAKPIAASLGVEWEPRTPAPVPPQSQQAQEGPIQPAALPVGERGTATGVPSRLTPDQLTAARQFMKKPTNEQLATPEMQAVNEYLNREIPKLAAQNGMPYVDMDFVPLANATLSDLSQRGVIQVFPKNNPQGPTDQDPRPLWFYFNDSGEIERVFPWRGRAPQSPLAR